MALRTGPLRTGLLGYGMAGRVFHAPLITATPGLALSAVVTRAHRDEVRAAHPSAAVVDHVEELFGLELDLLVVASPNRTHVPLALAAIEAGIPVVVDKPLAATSADARRVLKAAEYRGVPLTVFQNRRWDSDFLTVRSLLADGALGRVTRFESRFERWVPEVPDGWRERPEPDEAGGVWYDLGAHLVDQALQLFGPVRTVYAELDERRPGALVDDDAFVALTHVDGVRSHLWASATAAHRGPRLRVLGSRAAYVSEGVDGQEGALAAGLPFEGLSTPGALGVGGDVVPVPGVPGAYSAFYRLLVAALTTGGPMPVDPESAVPVLEVIEAASQSARTGQVVAV
ncbi:Gfo/Idh/MocA family protein [Saccharothrix australiensis]|uniref:Putative dehydrogenase n=1 Tax=Saccharothrix australiensis TaxID=2072 RepID=A0A495W6Q8_9PSEU|nr:Gfo/Idh/MocA family oxidoreductase [Saccharothrix australiensis]RKT57352.1 putative dehydrogenase [Saccharothrix australiensis]